MSDPDQRHAREALAKLEHLVVQDIFLTETAWHADVVFPASAHAEKLGTYTNTNRQVQLGRPVLSLPGEARQDVDLIISLANRLGLGWDYGQTGNPMASNRRGNQPYLRGNAPSHDVPRRLALCPDRPDGTATYPAPRRKRRGKTFSSLKAFRAPAARASSCRPACCRRMRFRMRSFRWF